MANGESGWTGWREAAERALYGPEGFYRRGGAGPAGHFRTSVHASPLFAAAVAELLRRVATAPGGPAEPALVDVGAGRGELLAGVLRAYEGPGRVRPYAVEVGPRPDDLDSRIEWLAEPPAGVAGLLFANEWLDNVPADVAETDGAGVPRYVEVAADGAERLGAPVTGADAEWLRRWWPLAGAPAGSRAEIGAPRDAAWSAAVSTLSRGAAVAVDYAHTRRDRPAVGTLAGYRDGRPVRPVPDGSCDVTAHVALDAAGAAGAAAGAPVLLSQRDALRALGLDATRPPLSLATSDPATYVRRLAAAGEAAELMDPAGLGGFTWLIHHVGIAGVLP